jgi:O-methyltransferase
LSGGELERATDSNRDFYKDVWAIAQRNFAPFTNAILIRGELPGTLQQIKTEKIAFLSVDLNIAATEEAVIQGLWPKLVFGGIVVIDDYAWLSHEAQFEVWNKFARTVDVPIVALPTGQGLMIKR